MWLAEKNQKKAGKKKNSAVFSLLSSLCPWSVQGAGTRMGWWGTWLLGRGDSCPADTRSSVLKTAVTTFLAWVNINHLYKGLESRILVWGDSDSMSMSHKDMWFDPNSIWPHGAKFLFLLFLIKKKCLNWITSLKNSEMVTWKSGFLGTFLVVQWLRIHLPMQGTQVWSLHWN